MRRGVFGSALSASSMVSLGSPERGFPERMPAAPGVGFASDDGDVNGDMQRDVSEAVFLSSRLLLRGWPVGDHQDLPFLARDDTMCSGSGREASEGPVFCDRLRLAP